MSQRRKPRWDGGDGGDGGDGEWGVVAFIYTTCIDRYIYIYIYLEKFSTYSWLPAGTRYVAMNTTRKRTWCRYNRILPAAARFSRKQPCWRMWRERPGGGEHLLCKYQPPSTDDGCYCAAVPPCHRAIVPLSIEKGRGSQMQSTGSIDLFEICIDNHWCLPT